MSVAKMLQAWSECHAIIQRRFPSYPHDLTATITKADFEWMLSVQNNIFAKYDLYPYTLYSQIEYYLLNNPDIQTQLGATEGICFIDFDDTICRAEHDANARLVRAHYNQVHGERWRSVLTHLRRRYTLILLTSRIPLCGETDRLLAWVIDGIPSTFPPSVDPSLKAVNLSGLFDFKLLTSNLALKGLVMEYIHAALVKRLRIRIPKEHFILVDDDANHLRSAASFGFRVIQSTIFGFDPRFVEEMDAIGLQQSMTKQDFELCPSLSIGTAPPQSSVAPPSLPLPPTILGSTAASAASAVSTRSSVPSLPFGTPYFASQSMMRDAAAAKPPPLLPEEPERFYQLHPKVLKAFVEGESPDDKYLIPAFPVSERAPSPSPGRSGVSGVPASFSTPLGYSSDVFASVPPPPSPTHGLESPASSKPTHS